MDIRFNELLAATATDGASTPLGYFCPDEQSEIDQLMHAWYVEREKSVECSLLLDETCGLLSSLLADGAVRATGRHKVRNLLRSIKQARRDSQGPGN